MSQYEDAQALARSLYDSGDLSTDQASPILAALRQAQRDAAEAERVAEATFPIPRRLFFELHQVLRFYARSGNYRPFRGGVRPVDRDGGQRAAAVLPSIDALWTEHDTMLAAMMDARHEEP